MRWGGISSELLMCDGGVLLPLVARCLETIDVCIWHMFFTSIVVTVWGGGVCCAVEPSQLIKHIRNTRLSFIPAVSDIIQRHGLSHHSYADDTQLYMTMDYSNND